MASSLVTSYEEQIGTLHSIHQDMVSWRRFVTSAHHTERSKDALLEAKQQVENITHLMTNRAAAWASLQDSKASIELNKTALRQNEIIKLLTQLAFIFILLSFATSLFGMNIQSLHTGSGTVWQVFVAVDIVYTVIGILYNLTLGKKLVVLWTWFRNVLFSSGRDICREGDSGSDES